MTLNNRMPGFGGVAGVLQAPQAQQRLLRKNQPGFRRIRRAGCKKVTIKFGNTAGEDDIQTMALREVAKRLSEESGGRIEAEIYPSLSLGDTDDLTEQAMQEPPS